VLVDYTAAWCPPCQALAPVLDELAAEQADRLTIVSVDVDEHPDVAGRARVMSMPTMVLYVNGEKERRLVGARGKARLLEDLDGAI
jgi:thioredoxin 1